MINHQSHVNECAMMSKTTTKMGKLNGNGHLRTGENQVSLAGDADVDQSVQAAHRSI